MAQESNNEKPKERVITFRTRGNNKLVNYVLTADDWLTLARAVHWEGPPQYAVAWTLLQRFAFLYPLYPTLAAFIRAYSQPINPKWFPDGSEHLKWVDTLQKAGRTAEVDKENKEAARRVSKAQTPLSAINKSYLTMLDTMFRSGAPSPVPGSNHYRAPTVQTSDPAIAQKARADFAARKQMIDNVHVGDPTKDNWFFSITGSRNQSIVLGLQDAANAAKNLVILLMAGGAFYWLYHMMQGRYYG